ncbi:MAG TPA: hypothetical protein EYN28_03675 [Flavobacteriales bacterium]|nr:hypothetical protein [Flavobacteriales bacterium]
MVTSLKTFWVAIFMTLSAMAGIAQNASVTTTVNSNPTRMGSQIQIAVTLDNCTSNSGRIPMPQISGLTFLGGPSTSHSNNWVNGTKSSKHIYTYAFSVSTDKDIKIPAIKVATSAGTLASKPFRLKVLAQGAKMPSSTSRNGLGQLATVIEVSKNKVYLGEPIVLVYKIYNQLNSLEVREYNVPELKGFWKEEVKETEEQTWKTQIIDGRRYSVITVQRIVAFPQQTGTFTIDGFNLKGYLRVNFFSGKNIEANSKAVTIEVMPLPKSKPANFIGTFKNLSLDSKVQIDSVKVNEAFNMTVTYSGSGNLKLLSEPKIVWPSEFEVFDPEVKDRISINSYGESGERTFKYVVVPRAPGTYSLPEVKISYFDSSSKRYVETSTSAGEISVSQSEGEDGLTTFGTKSDVTILNHDIRHINTDHSHWGSHNEDEWKNLFLVLLFLIGPVLATAALLFRKRVNSELLDPSGTRSRKARKALSKALVNCSSSPSKEEAFTTLGEALETYLCAKFALGRSSFSRPSAVQTIQSLINENDAKDWDSLLKTCEMARFAPGALPEVQASIEEANRLAHNCDTSLKESKKSNPRNGKIMASLLLGVLITGMSGLALESPQEVNNLNLDDTFHLANDAYAEGDYEKAEELYSEISEEHKCFELEYNLGNVHYKLNHIGEAILHYERAQLMKPLDADLRANLLLAELRAIDRIEPLPGVGVDKLVNVMVAGNMYGVWYVLSLIVWTVAFVLIAIRLRWADSVLTPFTKGGAVVSLFLAVIFLLFLYSTHLRVSNSSCSIILDSRVEVRSMPGELGMSLFQLHEGTKACVLSVENEWTEILLVNGNVGWLRTSSLEPI